MDGKHVNHNSTYESRSCAIVNLEDEGGQLIESHGPVNLEEYDWLSP
jgi:hypothetical protein